MGTWNNTSVIVTLKEAITKAFQYTIQKRIEVSFNYNISKKIIIGDFIFGSELGVFVPKPNNKNIGNFHTHVRGHDKFYSIADFREIQYYNELKLGLTDSFEIITINFLKIDKIEFMDDILQYLISNYEKDIYEAKPSLRNQNIKEMSIYQLKLIQYEELMKKYHISIKKVKM